jgi:periplasmic protein TonB
LKVPPKFQQAARERGLFSCTCAARAWVCGVHTSNKIFTLEDAMFKDATLEGSMFTDSMFADSMLETSWAQRTRRNWTTMTSFGLQAVIIGMLLLLPLLRTVGLPAARTMSTPISGRDIAVRPAPAPRTGSANVMHTNSDNVRFVAPGRIPTTIATTADEDTTQTTGEPCNAFCGPIGPSIGTMSGPAFPLPLGGGRQVLPTLRVPPSHAIRTSSMLEGNLIRRIEPVYPPLARSARIQGPVVLSALISKAGSIEDLRALSGHPMLVKAAIDAVSQWRYRPYILNNEPIEVETQITVNFYLAGN